MNKKPKSRGPLTSKESRDPRSDPMAQLIDRAKHDQAALAELLEKVRERALVISEKILYNRVDAEDTAQTVALRVFENLDSYQPSKGSVRGWIATIARNEAISLLRRRSRVTVTGLDIDPPSRECDDPAAACELQDRIAELERAIGQLGGAERTALRLRYHNDLPLKEIAARQNAPLGTIATRIHRALQRLRMSLRDAA